jgi:hypothetical protein
MGSMAKLMMPEFNPNPGTLVANVTSKTQNCSVSLYSYKKSESYVSVLCLIFGGILGTEI